MTFGKPEDCRFRESIPSPGGESHFCRRAWQIVDAEPAEEFGVSSDACEACCRMQPPERCNPVVASLVYGSTSRILSRGGLDSDRKVLLREAQDFAIRHLQVAEANGSGVFFHVGSNVVPCEKTIGADIEEDSRPLPLIGLAGRNSWQGLGHQNRDIVRHLPVNRWLIPSIDRDGPRPTGARCRVEFAPEDVGAQTLDCWLQGLGQLLFVETPFFPELPRRARSLGVTVVCVPNWEWLRPGLDWLDDVDRMLCPTEHTFRMLDRWKRQYGFAWELHYVPWPVDTRRLAFKQRSVCRRFLFVNGSGGVRPQREDGAPAGYRRKGLELVLEAAALVPEIPILAFSQSDDLPAAPANVELRRGPSDHRRLYDAGDVCLQPSHWEGLGLPLLECQAAGMPLVTIDAPPMNEYRPLRSVPVRATEAVRLAPGRWIPAQRVSPAVLAETLRSIHAADVSTASRSARRFVEQRHDWRLRRSELLRLISRPKVLSSERSGACPLSSRSARRTLS